MTKLWILSDVHLGDGDTYIPTPPADGYDVVVLAGDIGPSPLKSIMWAERTFMRPAVVVAGNHEYHSKGTYARKLSEGRRQKAPGVHFLENQAIVIAGTRFLGCTLWTDFAFDDDQLRGMHIAGTAMPDFMHMGKPGGGWMTASEVLAIHCESMAWLDAQFAEPFDGPTVVVTHHAPSRHSVGAEFKDSDMNVAFASHLDRHIERWQPELWIHGHIHQSSDYLVGETRVICNPKFGNQVFQKNLVVDVRKRELAQRFEDGVAVDEYGYPVPARDLLPDNSDDEVAVAGRTP